MNIDSAAWLGPDAKNARAERSGGRHCHGHQQRLAAAERETGIMEWMVKKENRYCFFRSAA
jgi:hypothetical protein